MAEVNKKIAYAVLSCDPYSDLWDVYGQMFQRFWPDCPFDCYLASHHKRYEKYGFKSILLGDDVNWSHGLLVLIKALKELGYQYAFIAFDDLLLCKTIDTEFINSAISSFLEEKGACLRFVPQKTTRCYKHNSLYGKMAVRVPYRVTLGHVLWDLDVLRQIAIEGESAWQFEKNATARSFGYDNFYCTWDAPFVFLNLVVKRKIDVKEYNKLKKYLPDVSFEREMVVVKGEKLRGVFLKTFFKYVPIKLQYPIYRFFSKPINI